jgi:hypothetical protein
VTGLEHYKAAEALLRAALDTSLPSDAALILAQAQTHATLALVAATADPRAGRLAADEEGGRF